MTTDSTLASNIVWLKTVDSTNRYALEHFDQLPDRTLVVAERQTAGRGRRGRVWLSPLEGNIYASWIMKSTAIPVWHTPRIAGLAVLDILRQLAPQRQFWLKWPNDLYCQEKKICGILSEVKSGRGNQPQGAVIGLGININMSEESLKQLDQAATSLYLETGKKFNPKKIAELLVIALNKYYITGFNVSQKLYSLWKNENILLGHKVDLILDADRQVSGRIIDIGFDGELKVETDADKIETFLSGDISISKASIKRLFS